ncbi:TlpA family protein disulfide reductase [Neobacillus piezotolerans]|uniref:TlpA family protein disulfide reductase n=1 Tax=Neobacillus piezotolerans TaxID=2259171 RepID=A0A3D8GTI6_9BACI|nr:redoxin domain-containing protein [Neobacillus piezotolerans]RDU37642.1 TlpA family protein disulfide reductase [Neobacillus piezotolerans]
MNKKAFAAIILSLAIAIIAVNSWKPLLSSGEKKTPEASESAANSNVVGIAQGNIAPDFELALLTGEKVKLSDYRGKKVILNFWATWCPPCKAEMPHMQSFYEKNKNKEMTILAVNLTALDKGQEAIDTFVKDYGLTFPIPLDEKNKIGTLYETITIPTSYIIGTDGRISKKYIGPMDEELMAKLLKEAN